MLGEMSTRKPPRRTWPTRQQFIFADFITKTNGVTNTSINAILGKSVPSGGLLPDLVDKNTLDFLNTGQIWEIKSVFSTAEAVAKVALYVSVLNYYGKGTGLKWIPGLTYIAPPIIPINPGTIATTSQPFPGVITYCVVNQTELLSLATASLATSVYLDFASASLSTAFGFAF